MNGKTLPGWAAPAAVVAVILGIAVAGRKHERAVENPLVDLAIITVGVFAFAAIFRVVAYKLNNPGMATFFGANASAPTTTITQ